MLEYKVLFKKLTNNNMQIRTRFSPSPTGKLHAGGARTALYNWLFARVNNGKFILRIEDTDIIRSKKIYIDNIIDSMKWLNIEWDEGPYFQTCRYQRYKEVIKKMLNLGIAYKCYCSQERLKKLRDTQLINGKKPKYDRFCLNKKNYHNNNPYVIRFFNNFKEKTFFKDKIRGLINFNNDELDDLIICRSDGSYTYNFCVVIDDLDMNITHVIRGEEHINNTPRQINIFKALNAKIPSYAHISTIFDDEGKKLSKRLGSTSIIKYRKNGYLSEAVVNHLIRLGWSYKNKEIFDINYIKKVFDINQLNKSPCFFNIKKLQWLNNFYIKNYDNNILAKKLNFYIKKEKININNGPELTKVIDILKSRSNSLKEIINSCRYFYEDTIVYHKNIKKYFNINTINILKIIYKKINNITEWNEDNIKKYIDLTIKELKINKKEIYIPIRIAITGLCSSPELTKILNILEKDRVLKRINNLINYLNQFN